MLDIDPEARPTVGEIFMYVRALAKGEQVPLLVMTEEALTQKQNRRNAEVRREQKALKKVRAPIVPAKPANTNGLDPNSVAAKRLAMKKGIHVPECASSTPSGPAVLFDADFSGVSAFPAVSQDNSDSSKPNMLTSLISQTASAADNASVTVLCYHPAEGFDPFQRPQTFDAFAQSSSSGIIDFDEFQDDGQQRPASESSVFDAFTNAPTPSPFDSFASPSLFPPPVIEPDLMDAMFGRSEVAAAADLGQFPTPTSSPVRDHQSQFQHQQNDDCL